MHNFDCERSLYPKMKNSTKILAAISLLSSINVPVIIAQSTTWTGATDGAFNTGTNWLSGTVPTGTATFDDTGSNAAPVTVNANYSISALTFSGTTKSYTVSGGPIWGGSGSNVVQLNSGSAAQNITATLSSSVRLVNFQNFVVNNSSSNLKLGNIEGNVSPAGLVYAFTPRGSGTGQVIVNGVIADKPTASLNLGTTALFRTGGSAITSPIVLNGANIYSGGTYYGAGTGGFVLGNKSALGTGTFNVLGSGLNLSSNTDLSGANAIANTIRFDGAIAASVPTASVTAMGNTAPGGDRSVITVSSATGLVVGQTVNYLGSGFGIPVPYGTTITAISGNDVTLSNPVPTGVTATTVGTATNRFGTYGTASSTTVISGANNLEFSGTMVVGSAKGNNAGVTQTFNVTNTGLTTFSGGLIQETGITGGIVKTGVGTLVLSGANTYTGTTMINGGSLVINGNQSTATGAVTVNTGATLGGSGTIGGNTTIAAGGILAPGNSPGVLSFAGNLTLNGTSVSNFEINGVARGTQYDGVNVSGNLTYGGTFNLIFGTTLLSGGTFDLFNTIGSVSSSFTSIVLSGSYTGTLTDGVTQTIGGQNFTFTGSTGDLLITAIPEPSAFALLVGFGALGCVVARRRRTVR